MKRLLLLIAIFSTNVYAIGECEKLKNSKRLLKLINQLENYEDQTGIWPGQNLSTFTYVLTDFDVTSGCAVVLYDNFKKEYIKSTSPIKYENGFFNFYSKNNPPKNAELKSFFNQKNIEVAYAQNFTNILGQIPNYLLRIFGFLDGNFYLNLLLHEGFHLSTQLTSSNWISWTYDVSFDRFELAKKCYEDKRVVELFEKEFEAILSAYQLLKFHKDSGLAAKALKDYYSLSAKRYSILKNVTLDDTVNNKKLSCKQAEVIMEHREGVAEFYGNMVLYNQGLMNEYNLYAILMEKRKGDSFYGIGMVKQLYLYRKLGTRYINMVMDMLNNDDSQFDQDYYVRQNL